MACARIKRNAFILSQRWPASVMRDTPLAWYFIPSYFLGVSALFVHIGCATRQQVIRVGHRKSASLAFWVITAVRIVLAVQIDSMLLGAFFDIQLPDAWNQYAGAN